MEKEKDLELLEELEELEEETVDYAEYLKKLRTRGREIFLRHCYTLARVEEVVAVGGASPMASRVLNRNEGSAPTVFFRVYCGKCGRVRTLIVVPSRHNVLLKASCVHVVDDAAAAAREGSRLVYVGRYRVVPAGLAALLGERILG